MIFISLRALFLVHYNCSIHFYIFHFWSIWIQFFSFWFTADWHYYSGQSINGWTSFWSRRSFECPSHRTQIPESGDEFCVETRHLFRLSGGRNLAVLNHYPSEGMVGGGGGAKRDRSYVKIENMFIIRFWSPQPTPSHTFITTTPNHQSENSLFLSLKKNTEDNLFGTF